MSQQSKNADSPSRRRRWWQFGLRGLLFLVLLIAVGLLACRQYLKPYWRQQQTVALVERLGGSCQTTEAGDWWLRLAGSAQNVTQVNLADCDAPDAYVAEVAELPAIELLIVGGPAFTDEHARRLHPLRTLHGLILDCTSVSDEGLAALREALNGTEVHVSQRRAIAAVRKQGDGLAHQGDGFAYSTRPARSALQELAGDEWFREPEGFYTRRKEFGDVDIARLRPLRGLRQTNLGNTQVTDAGLENLREMSQLQVLDLRGTRVTDAGLEHLKGLGQLQLLLLDGAQVTGPGLESLQRLGQMQSLYLSDTQVDDAGLRWLTGMSQLDRLELAATRVTDAGVEHLKGLSQLQVLNLRDCRITDAGIEHLKGLTKLRTLFLFRTHVGDQGSKHLKALGQLQFLDLSSTQTTDAGLEHLKEMPQLQWLGLSGCSITDAGLVHLNALTQLGMLYLTGTRVTSAGVARLRQSLPNCQIEGP